MNIHWDLSEEKEKVSKAKDFFADVLAFMICGAAVGVVLVAEEVEAVREKRKAEFKRKLKNFVPTITETSLGKTISWTLREKPLSDEDTEELYNRLK